MRKIAFIAACLGLVAAMGVVPSGAAAQNVGTAAAVKPTSTGTPPGGSARVLEIGTDISSRERIETSSAGSLQVMFLDKTTLTIGPNSDLLIDEFVYSPGAADGQFVATLTKGALRFVGGQISHNRGAIIDTPSATIGIRGGAAIVEILRECLSEEQQGGRRNELCTRVACTAGQCTVTAKGANVSDIQLRIGQAVEVGNLGPTPTFNATSVRLSNVAAGGDTVGEGETNPDQDGKGPGLLLQQIGGEIPGQEPPPSTTEGP